MKLFKYFKIPNETKSYSSSLSSGCSRQSFIDHLLQNKQYDLAASQAVNYYGNCAPLYTAIDWVATEAASIDIMLWDSSKKEYVKNHPVIDLLESPNADATYEEFLYGLVAFFLLTGNSYITADGDVMRPPVSLWDIPPQAVTFTVASDGYPASFTAQTAYDAHTFTRKLVNSRFRYYENNIRELYQIKTFNPDATNFRIVGKSPLNSIYYEIEQYLAASTHNLSLLKRGATLGGIFKHGSKLTDDSYRRLQNQIDIFFSGERNAGRPILAEDGLDFTATGQTNKDMDFMELKRQVTAMIYNVLRIPLPLVSESTMTLANMESAKLNLYDNAVLPVVNRIFAELSNFLLPRYPNSEGLVFAYDPGSILALEPRRNENLKFLNELNVLTTNEVRAQVGYEALEGGDDLYQPSTNVPFARDTDTST